MPTATAEPTLLRGKTYDQITDTVGNTPLVKVSGLGPDNGSTIYLKCEFFNPLSSVKDRIGKAMIEAGERSGAVNQNTHIIEPTSGNTGIALAFVCAAKGYKLTLTMPESMSTERRQMLKALGANLVLTEASKGMKGAIEKAAELVGTTDNAWMPQQFDNPANPEVHYRTTGPEIWNDTDGNVDILVSGVGTGGTISGAGKFLKEQNPDFKCIAVEPTTSPVISGGEPGPHKIQGIGAGFVPKNLQHGHGRRHRIGQQRRRLRLGPQSRGNHRHPRGHLHRCQRPRRHPRRREKPRQDHRHHRLLLRRTLPEHAAVQ